MGYNLRTGVALGATAFLTLLSTLFAPACAKKKEPVYTPLPAIVTPAPPLELPQSILRQIDYFPGNIRSSLISELKAETDWDRDGIVNPSDNYVLDPSNTIKQPKPATINFTRNLKQYNKDKLLPQVYKELALLLFTVDSNPEYFQETTPGRAHVTVKLVDGIPNIVKYPRALNIAALQTDKQGLSSAVEIYLPNKQIERIDTIEKYVIPAVEFIVRLQEEGKIDALNGWNLTDKVLEDEALGQVILPEELRKINIKTGENTVDLLLTTGISNVSYDVDLGKSPEEWLREIAVRDYQDKSSRGYKEAVRALPPLDVWPNTSEEYMKKRNEMLASGDDLPMFIRGYPTSLRVRDIVTHNFHEGSDYAVLVGRLFGKPVLVVVTNYPRYPDHSREFVHREPYVLANNGKLFGFWLDKQALLKDYEGKLNEPRILFISGDGSTSPYTLDD